MDYSKNEYRSLVGQRIVAGFYGTELGEDIIDLIVNYKVANIILFRHNIENNEQVKRLCKEIQDLVVEHTGHDAFITIDQEGGMVTRLSEDGINIPGAMALAATNNIDNVYEAGKITGVQLRELGINFNLAPTVDVNSNIHNPVIGVRSYGDKPEEVSKYARAMTKGLLDGGVYACGKHFPGHGDTNVDSHIGLPVINKSIEELMECELIPFKGVIEEGIPAIMTTHILFPQIELENKPATMSRIIVTDLLKGWLGFKGLVVSDCMEMDAIQKFYGTVEGVKSAIKAGVDMVFISHTAEIAKEVSNELVRCLESGDLGIEEMREVVSKIYRYREASKAHDVFNVEEQLSRGRELAYELLKDSLTEVVGDYSKFQLGDNPVFISPSLFRESNVSNEVEELSFAEYLYEYFGGSRYNLNNSTNKYNKLSEEDIEKQIQAQKEDIIKSCKDASSIVIGTYNGHIYQQQLTLIDEILTINQNVIVFALRNPYDFRNLVDPIIGIGVYEYTRKSLKAIKELLLKEYMPKGILPVDMR